MNPQEGYGTLRRRDPVGQLEVGLRLRRALGRYLGLAPNALRDDLPVSELLLAAEDLGEIVVVIETEFGIDVPEYAIDRVRCIGDLVRVVTVCLWAAQGTRRDGIVRKAA